MIPNPMTNSQQLSELGVEWEVAGGVKV